MRGSGLGTAERVGGKFETENDCQAVFASRWPYCNRMRRSAASCQRHIVLPWQDEAKARHSCTSRRKEKDRGRMKW
jgi:hypothetical protein